MNYEIELGSDALKYLSKMEKPLRIRILDQLHILSKNPRHSELNIKKLQGYINLYRLRVGSYRILYSFILYKYFHVKSPFHFSRVMFRNKEAV
ncbi:UNVERIFIED_CONTAM: mRNA interferase RelE/StbE [Paenibacillus sp. PvR008]